jgi:hypothetical protein
LVALYLSGCAGGAGRPGGFGLTDIQSTLQSVNGMTGNVRDLQNNLQMLMVKLNTYASVTEDRLQNVNVGQLTQALENLSQSLTGGMGGLQVDKAVANIAYRIPLEVKPYWQWIVIPTITAAINIQASYLNVAVQYMNKNATTMLPNEVSRLSTAVSTALGTFNSLGI